MIELTDENFEIEVIRNKSPVLVEFYTTWCVHCAAGTRNLKRFAEETGCKAGKMDLQQNPKTMCAYFAGGLPYYVLFVRGELVKRAKGIVDLKKEFEPLISENGG